MRNISESIAHDGRDFYCRLCGRAGYKSLAAVKGHLSQCPGKLVQRGVLPAQPQLAAAGLGWAGPADSAPLQKASPAAPTAAPGGLVYELREIAAGVRSNTEQISRMQNEYTHLMVQRNQPRQEDWFGQNKGLVIMVVIVAFIFWTMNQSSCPSNCGESNKTGRSRVSSLGEKAASKLIDRGITKSVDKLFG